MLKLVFDFATAHFMNRPFCLCSENRSFATNTSNVSASYLYVPMSPPGDIVVITVAVRYRMFAR